MESKRSVSHSGGGFLVSFNYFPGTQGAEVQSTAGVYIPSNKCKNWMGRK